MKRILWYVITSLIAFALFLVAVYNSSTGSQLLGPAPVFCTFTTSNAMVVIFINGMLTCKGDD